MMNRSLETAFAAMRAEADTLPSQGLEREVRSSLASKQRARRKRRLIVILGQLLIPACFFAIWEIASRSGLLQNADAFYSKPSSVAAFFLNDAPDLFWQTLATMKAVVLGGGMGMLLGGAAGLILGRLETLNRMLDPTITVLAGLPRIALAPIFLLWFGITIWAKVFLSFSIVFFIMLINIRAGVKTVESRTSNCCETLGRTPGSAISIHSLARHRSRDVRFAPVISRVFGIGSHSQRNDHRAGWSGDRDRQIQPDT